MLHQLQVETHGQSEFIDVTGEIAQLVRAAGVADGMVVIYCPHTTCGLTIQENADPGVQHDMLLLLHRLVPRDDPAYRHIEDNSASHLQASMMGFSQTVLITRGRLLVGQWQAIYLTEFDGPRERTLFVKLIDDASGTGPD
jgi:secondary thiamine-phosphate synthase enzyme